MSMDMSPASLDGLHHARRMWEVAEELAAPPLVYSFTAEERATPFTGRVTCAWCGTEHAPESDARMWDCCAERRHATPRRSA